MFFVRLFGASLKSPLKNPILASGLVLCALLSLLLGLLLPSEIQIATDYGVYAHGKTADEALEIISNGQRFQLVEFDSAAALKQAVLAGKIHCGYILEDGGCFPVTSVAGENAYMRSALDRLAAGAYFEAAAPAWTADFLARKGLDVTGFDSAWAAAEKTHRPLVANMVYSGADTVHLQQQSTPIGNLGLAAAYSLIPALALAAAVCRENRQEQALRLLAQQKGTVLTYGVWGLGLTVWFLLALEGTLALLCVTGSQPWRILEQSLGGAVVLGLLTALIYTLGSLCPPRYKPLLMSLCPLWVLVSVVCGGGIVSPEHIPYGLGFLEYISPASLFPFVS